MLNISPNSIDPYVDKEKYQAFQILASKYASGTLIKVLLTIIVLAIGALFLPWTQNIRSKGYVNTLYPSSRPQSIQVPIGGKIESWYVREGQVVNAGDTIARITEVKQEYLDPEILARTNSQIEAKSASADAYKNKELRLQEQLNALTDGRTVKLEQNEIKRSQIALKIQSDSIELINAELNAEIAKKQLDRIAQLNKEGIKSLTDLESKRLSYQEKITKVVSLENKLSEHRNELTNINANINAINNDYESKIAKIRSEMMTARSDRYNAEASQNKLQSDYNAYEQRQANYFIKSPIDGIITKTLQAGIGEIIKDGEKLATIMPTDYELAIEMYIEPMDMPLVSIGNKVRIIFDGWPAIVFSGWPNNSYGTFGGKIWAIDQSISENGKYRILVAPDPDESPWPDAVRVGGGANMITLLQNVSVGYELWRQLNGFPPDYYELDEASDLKSKAPLKKVK